MQKKQGPATPPEAGMGRVLRCGIEAEQYVIQKLGPRPATDYAGLVGCDACGKIRPEGETGALCRPCLNNGHIFRLKDAREHRWCAFLELVQSWYTWHHLNTYVSRKHIAIARKLEAAAQRNLSE